MSKRSSNLDQSDCQAQLSSIFSSLEFTARSLQKKSLTCSSETCRSNHSQPAKPVPQQLRSSIQHFLKLFIPLSMLVVGVSAKVYFDETRYTQSNIAIREIDKIERQQAIITREFEPIISDLKVLSSHHELRELLDGNINRKSELAEEYLNFVQHKKIYDRIRLIDLKGQEIVKVKFVEGQYRVLPETELEAKITRPYFTKSVQLQAGEIYVSPLDLTVERGQIERPFKPAIRFAVPVFDSQGNKRGVLMLNYLGDRLREQLNWNDSTRVGDIMLLNRAGYWLKSPKPQDEWGFMFSERQGRTFSSAFPLAWRQISTSNSGQFQTAEGLFTFTSINPALEAKRLIRSLPPTSTYSPLDLSSEQWKLVSYIAPEALNVNARQRFNQLLIVDLCLLSLLAIGVRSLVTMRGKNQQAQTDRQKVLQELERQKFALDRAALVAITDPQGVITYVNDTFCQLSQYSREELIGKTHSIINSGYHPMSFFQQMWSTIARGLVWKGEIRNRAKDGSFYWVDTTIIPFLDENGKPFQYLAIRFDITERKQAESQLHQQAYDLSSALRQLQETQSHLIQSEKMSSLGQLVAGVAHEINNPVNFISGNVVHVSQYVDSLLNIIQAYQQSYPHPLPEVQEEIEAAELEFLVEDLPKLISSMQIGAKRIGEIVTSLRNFSRLDEAEYKSVDIHEGIDNSLMILQNRIKAKAERPAIIIDKNYGKLPQVECYPGQLNQVFMNILANAIDALDERDSQRKFTEIEQNPDRIWITTEVVRLNWVQIRIKDNGLGIPEIIKNRIFDPFFTTKAIGKGTGLGMSISYKIIKEKHQGSLSCISAVGEGTEFIVEIPLHQVEKS